MKTYEINGKSLQVGRDVFELDDISEMMKVSEDYLNYQIEVMTARQNNDAVIESRFTSNLVWLKVPFPRWNWENYKYRVFPEPTYEQLQSKWVEENNVKVGNKVKILDAYDRNKLGCGCTYVASGMGEYIGQEGEIKQINCDCIRVEFDDDSYYWEYPFQVLELAPKPQYIPYTFEDFCRLEMYGKAIRQIEDNQIGYLRHDALGIYPIVINFEHGLRCISYEELKDEYTFLDGSPCGVKI